MSIVSVAKPSVQPNKLLKEKGRTHVNDVYILEPRKCEVLQDLAPKATGTAGDIVRR